MPATCFRLFLPLILLAVFFVAPPGAYAEETEMNKGPYQYASVSLIELQRNPAPFRNQFVTFECKFAQVGSLYKEVQTGLLPELHQNFYAWAPTVRLWLPEQRKNLVCLTLYLLKASGSYKAFNKLQPLERIIVWGQIRSDLGGAPWIEVRQIDRASGPNISEAQISLVFAGYNLLNEGKYALALPNFLKVLSGNLPKMEEGAVSAYAGECYYALGNYRLAAKFFDRAVELDPYNYELVKAQVRAYYKSKNYGLARQLAERALEANKNLHDVRVVLALIKGIQGDNEGGQRDIEFVLLRDSNNVEAYKARAELYKMKGDYQGALKAIESAIVINQNNAELQYERAFLFEQLGDFEKAKQGYENALTLQPNYTHALIALARIAMKQGDKAAAARYLEMASGAEMPADKLVEIGYYFAETGDNAKAISYFTAAIEKDPNFVEAWLALGSMHLQAGRFTEAENAYNRAYALIPGDRDARIGLCRAILWQEKKPRIALDVARSLQTDFPKDATSQALLGFALTLDGKAADGEAFARTAVAAEPANIEFAYYLGYNLFVQKKYTEAVPVLEQVVKAGGFFGERAKPMLETAKAEAVKSASRDQVLAEKQARDEERRNAAEEKKRADLERREQAKAERQKKTTVTAKTEQPTATRPVAQAKPSTAPAAQDKTRVTKPFPEKTAQTTATRPEKKVVTEPSSAPESWLKKYGYKPYVPPPRPTIELSKDTSLPEPEEAVARILSDILERRKVSFKPYEYTLEQKHADDAKYQNKIKKTSEKNAKDRAAAIAETERRAKKSQDILQEEREHQAARFAMEQKKANTRAAKAMEKVRNRYASYSKEHEMRLALKNQIIEEHVANTNKIAEQAKQYAAAYEKERAQDNEKMLASAAKMRSDVQADIAKFEAVMAEKEAKILANSDKTFDKLKKEMEQRKIAIAIEDERIKKKEEEDFLRRMREYEKNEADKIAAIEKIRSFYTERREGQEKLESTFERKDKARIAAFEAENKRVEEMKRRAEEAYKEFQEYTKKTEAYRAKKVNDFAQATAERNAFLANRAKVNEERREKYSARRQKDLEKRFMSANLDLSKLEASMQERLAEREMLYKKALEDAAKMQKKADEERERIKKQAEKDRDKMLEQRYR